MALYIGLMSGTSMDGIDAVLVQFSDSGGLPTILASHSEAIPAPLRAAVIDLSQNRGTPDDLGHCDRQLGECFASATLHLLDKAGRPSPETIRAIGSHGQTVRHQPRGEFPFTLQIGDPTVITERTGISTVADFRRRDMAAGGQGAPLVPAFHHAVFASPDQNRALLNIGGIANLSWLPAGATSANGGFDTGPGNGLMDAWCQRRLGQPFDDQGRWALRGEVYRPLLEDMLREPYFQAAAPKSTGKELFNLHWLDTWLTRHPGLAPEDVQRTLLELTAVTVVNHLPETRPVELYVCGGGARNRALMDVLRNHLSNAGITLDTTSALGVDPQWVEAVAFAWLAKQTMEGRPGNVPAVTGAAGERILGAVYPA